MIASPNALVMSPEDYLEWEEHQFYKFEYLNGEAVAMVGGSLPHNAVALNLAVALKFHLKGTGCRVFINDVKVQAKPLRAYFYPDLVVTCDPRDLKAKKLIQYPTLIIEILSPTTERYDRGEKFRHYRQCPSLQEYVLVNPEQIGIETFRLNQQGKWELSDDKADADADSLNQDLQVEFTSINFCCPVSLIYEDVDLLVGDSSREESLP